MNKILKVLSFTVVLILFSSALKAQTQFVTNEVRQFMSKGEQNGIEILLNGTREEDARDALEKWGKKMKGKVVRDKKNPEIFIDNAQIPTVSANMLDMYAVVTPADNGSKVTLFTDLGGAFISSAAYGTQYSGLEAAIKKFAKDQAIVEADKQVKDEEKILKTLNSDQQDLLKKKQGYQKDIEKAKALIIKREQATVINDATLASKQQLLSTQLISDEKLLKQLNSEIKGLIKNKDGYKKDIDEARALISKREQDIVQNEKDQSVKQEQISIQQQIVETVKTKRATLNY